MKFMQKVNKINLEALQQYFLSMGEINHSLPFYDEILNIINNSCSNPETEELSFALVLAPKDPESSSLFSLYLASVFASLKEKTLLIDSDCYNGFLSKVLNENFNPFVSDPFTLRSNVVHQEKFGFDFIPSPSNPSVSGRFFSHLRTETSDFSSLYNHTIVCLPPLFKGQEILSFSGKDISLFLTAFAGVDKRCDVISSEHFLQKNGLPIEGTVLLHWPNK
jgi:hypothetical protein